MEKLPVNTPYKSDFDELNKKASTFKISDFGQKDSSNVERLKDALETMKKQKTQYDSQLSENERKILEDQAQIDYEKIFTEYGDLKEVLNIKNTVSALKDFRMKRMFEILNPKIGVIIKNKNEKILESIQIEIEGSENKLQNVDQTFVRQAKFLEYKQNLSESGHICITPSVAKDLEAIGDRMLTDKPVFLHGPTGMGRSVNTLKNRFMDNTTFSALYQQEYNRLKDIIFNQSWVVDKIEELSQVLINYNKDNEIVKESEYISDVEKIKSFFEETEITNNAN